MPSKGEINRSGAVLRRLWLGDAEDIDGDTLASALEALREFRKGHQNPMKKTAVGVRQFVGYEAQTIIVAQRLKRVPQIIHKLGRMPDTMLARMEDIGGCRAVLADRTEIDGVLLRINKNWDVKRERDYIAEPKSSGYRGVHVVIERDAHRIEIQLRTRGQQDWANTVERWAGRYRIGLKDEQGPDEVLEWFRLAGEGIAHDELGEPLRSGFATDMREARRRVVRWLSERDGSTG
jgi:putative GTP pyrophosphokinase